jgi:hypothetical protein
MCTRSMNLGCCCVGFFDVLMFSPFVPNTVKYGFVCWPVVTDASLLTQGSCQGRGSGRLKQSGG